MKRLKLTLVLIFILAVNVLALQAEPGAPVKVGVPSVLSGEFSVLGENIRNTAETYRRHYLRHNLQFIYEDARLSSVDGLKAYQKLISLDHVDVLIGGTSSNGTIAAKSIINSSRTVMITPVTGGSNIDSAGEYIFRIGNSDLLNGLNQAEYFIARGIKRVALLTESTEYTEDIAHSFREKFRELRGELVYDQDFLPGAGDFRTQILKMTETKPQALFVGTQAGVALGLFVKQLAEMGKREGLEVHTTFVAAPNPDTYTAGGEAIYGVRYMAPVYDRNNPELRRFFELYRKDHGKDPAIPFHTAGTVDALNMLQNYLDSSGKYDRQGFQKYLLTSIRDYHGLMGTYSFDAEGNARTGFEPAVIEK